MKSNLIIIVALIVLYMHITLFVWTLLHLVSTKFCTTAKKSNENPGWVYTNDVCPLGKFGSDDDCISPTQKTCKILGIINLCTPLSDAALFIYFCVQFGVSVWLLDMS